MNKQESLWDDFDSLSQENFLHSYNELILSVSGWRKIFTFPLDENSPSSEIGTANKVISALMALSFSEYIIKYLGNESEIALGTDTRPTGKPIAEIMLRVFLAKKLKVHFLSVTAAPEIMAYSKNVKGFAYISASHNPIGHNGVKFGLSNGGVLDAAQSAEVTNIFKDLCNNENAITIAKDILNSCPANLFSKTIDSKDKYKSKALSVYYDFTKIVSSGTMNNNIQQDFFVQLKKGIKQKPINVVCDMNGSARTLSIDKSFLTELGIEFCSINSLPGQIVHEIIPEPENLKYCADKISKIAKNTSLKKTIIGYMPDCDGDRGNIVFWDEKTNSARILKAQEVFALSVMAELSYLDYISKGKEAKVAISVNDPTSMRIDEIAQYFGAEVFRAEVGEANVVNLARELRENGYTVPILGEGSNGGNITHPAAVRDPINTLMSLIKLLSIRDTEKEIGLFHRWCIKSHQENAYSQDFSLAEIISTLPCYTTTGVSEKRALLKFKSLDQVALKRNFQNAFEKSFEEKKDILKKSFGIFSYEAICNNGTKETKNIKDFSISGKGGLKILFKDLNSTPIAFIWMRGSGTEPVFRIMCDVKGNNKETEEKLLKWETELLLAENSN